MLKEQASTNLMLAEGQLCAPPHPFYRSQVWLKSSRANAKVKAREQPHTL